MFASKVPTPCAQAVENPRTDIAGTLKDKVRGHDGSLHHFQVVPDFRMGSYGIVTGLGMPRCPAEYHSRAFVVGGFKYAFGLQAHQGSLHPRSPGLIAPVSALPRPGAARTSCP